MVFKLEDCISRSKKEHGGVLKEHHCQRAHEAVMQSVFDFTRLSGIVDFFEKLRVSPSKRIEAQMFFDMHSSQLQ